MPMWQVLLIGLIVWQIKDPIHKVYPTHSQLRKKHPAKAKEKVKELAKYKNRVVSKSTTFTLLSQLGGLKVGFYTIHWRLHAKSTQSRLEWPEKRIKNIHHLCICCLVDAIYYRFSFTETRHMLIFNLWLEQEVQGTQAVGIRNGSIISRRKTREVNSRETASPNHWPKTPVTSPNWSRIKS